MRISPFAAIPLAAHAALAATASGLGNNFASQMYSLIALMQSVMPVLALGLFVFAGLVYAVGQVFDAQTRQKAQTWAMAIIVGTIIGVLIVIVAPWLVNFLVGFSSSP